MPQVQPNGVAVLGGVKREHEHEAAMTLATLFKARMHDARNIGPFVNSS